MQPIYVNGILLIYHHPISANAPTIMEHVNSFERYSQFNVWKINTEYGFPSGLRQLEFAAIVLHYSPFGTYPFRINEKFCQYIEGCERSVKIVFFQDEYRYCQQRFALINKLGIDIIYTLLESQYFEEVYYRNTKAKRVLPTLTGYVCDSLLEKARRFSKPFDSRDIDVGYRARTLPFYMGRGAQEKTDIAKGFIERATNLDFHLDIKTDENDRIYGDDWYRFVGNCKFMLGVEAGVSVFDLDGKVAYECNELISKNPQITFDEVAKCLLTHIDGKIEYRMISPRIFEAAAMGVVPILFSGKYNGVIYPFKNYIELYKDFSNIDAVFNQMRDQKMVQDIQKNNKMLVETEQFHYRAFLASFDHELSDMLESSSKGVESLLANKNETLNNSVTEILEKGKFYREAYIRLKKIKSLNFPGLNILKNLYRKLLPL